MKGSSKLNRRSLKLKSKQMLLFDRYIHQIRPKMKRSTTSKLILNKLGKPISVSGINSIFDQLALLFPDRNLNPRAVRVIAGWINEKKLPLETVQELWSHKWPSSTEKYRRPNDGEQHKLINQFFPI